MNSLQIRNFIRQVITEAKEAKEAKKEEKAPKSSGKLVDLKKELTALKAMKEELQAAKFAEKSVETEVEFANLAKFAKELDKLRAGGVALEAGIDAKIDELKAKIESETNKIKEMIGLASSPTIVGEKKDKKVDNKGKMMDEKKKMTPPQKEKKEDIVKGIKKSGSFGKSKEGEKAMYATATKLATKK